MFPTHYAHSAAGRNQSPVSAVAGPKLSWPKLIFNSFGAETVAKIRSVSKEE